MMDIAFELGRWEEILAAILLQTTLLAALTLTIARCFPRSAATRQHVLWMGVVAVVVCPALSFALRANGIQPLRLPRLAAPLDLGSPLGLANADLLGSDSPGAGSMVGGRQAAIDENPAGFSPLAAATAAQSETSGERNKRNSSENSLLQEGSRPASATETVDIPGLTPADSAPQPLTIAPLPFAASWTPPQEHWNSFAWTVECSTTLRWFADRAALIVGLVWLGGFVLMAVGLLRSVWNVRSLLQAAEPIEGSQAQAAIALAQCDLGLSRFPTMLASNRVSSPSAAGWLRPAIVLPAGFTERMRLDDLRMVLVHEAAHIIRRDQWLLLVERCFLAVFWFHPLCHWLVAELSRAREEVCDNHVLLAVNGPSYGETLLRLSTSLPSPQTFVGVGLFSLRWKLEERISGLLDERRTTMVQTSWMSRGIVVTGMLAATLLVGSTQLPAFEDQQGKDQPAKGNRFEEKDVEDKSLDDSVAASESSTDLLAANDRAAAAKTKTGDKRLNPRPAAPSQEDEVVVTVNGEPITRRELHSLWAKKSDDSVDYLVNRKLLEQAASEAGITVSAQQVDAEIERLAKRFGLSYQEFCEQIKKNRDLSEDQYRQLIVWPTIVLRRLAGDETSMAAYFDKLREQSKIRTVAGYATALTSSRDSKRKGKSGKRTRIAMVDVARIFKESPLFLDRIARLKLESQQRNGQLRHLVNEIKSLQAALQAIPVSNDTNSARTELTKLIATKQAQHKLALDKARHQVMERESTTYHSVYTLIYEEIRKYAQEKDFDLVLRMANSENHKSALKSIDPAEVNPKNSQAVLRHINQNVLYVHGLESDDQINITDQIIKRLESKAKRY